jgi:uncharacterized Fe-S radical SAM superfamily protein PflX
VDSETKTAPLKGCKGVEHRGGVEEARRGVGACFGCGRVVARTRIRTHGEEMALRPV